MSGERNHKYFEDSVIMIEEAKVVGTVYHINQQMCPSIELGFGECIGEFVTYNDPEGKITTQIIEMEQQFDGLDYNQIKTQAVIGHKVEDIKIFCYPLANSEKAIKVTGRWSEQNYKLESKL